MQPSINRQQGYGSGHAATKAFSLQGFLPDVRGAFPPLGSVGQAIAEHQKKVRPLSGISHVQDCGSVDTMCHAISACSLASTYV